MSKIIFFLCIIFFDSKSDIGLVIDPNSERVPISNHNPLSDVKLLLVYKQRVLNIFLHNPVSTRLLINVFEYFPKLS